MKNRLELLLMCVEKAIAEQGKVSKGCKSGEDKQSYAQALKDFKKLETYFQYRGMRTFGVCYECTHFTIRGHQSQYGEFGTCKKSGKTTHCFESCQYSSNAL